MYEFQIEISYLESH